VRHLWSSVRPNGDRRPYNLNRLELRICDLVVDPVALLAVTAFLEARLLQLKQHPSLDPLETSLLPTQSRSQDLLELTDTNEMSAARDSLEAELRHWRDGRKIVARNWIAALYEAVWPIAKKHGFGCFLAPLKKILRAGNEAQHWLKLYRQGYDSQRIITQAIQKVALLEQSLEDDLCEPLVA
ncbi:MAG: glutamate--cysteine ligase, partial [Pseudanabaenales cyanobacterium]|nr:glutamate--cysteine ligase [Pseudanabaenales cyanobacterium]